MATILTPDYSNFLGSPVIVPVRAGSPAGATFHRVRLRVKLPADVADDSPSASIFEFSTPVSSGGEQVQFDIASAFRAFADSHEYGAGQLNVYPNMSAACTAYDDYMVDGEEHTGTSPSEETTIGPVYCGFLTDMERLQGFRYPATGRYSRKPTSSPELAFIGYTSLQPGPCVSETTPVAPAVIEVAVPAGFPTGNTGIYGIPAPADGYELRFINSLGVHENVFLTGLPIEETNIQTDQYAIARQETLTRFSRRIAIKQNNHEVWHMSSPVLDRPWQQWYIHELLQARWAWLNISQQHASPRYVPVNILPGENVNGRDRQKADLLTVEFDLEFDINGSPLL